jgi:hypothetical protein
VHSPERGHLKGLQVIGSNRNRTKLLSGIGLALGLLSLGLAWVRWTPSRKVSADTVPSNGFTLKQYDSLRSLMRSGIQHEYDYLNAAVPLRASLEGRKLDAISTSAGRLYNLARETATYERDFQAAGKSPADLKFFHDQVMLLDRTTQDLQDAALRRNLDRIGTSFEVLAKTCNDCHTRLGVNMPEEEEVKKEPARGRTK